MEKIRGSKTEQNLANAFAGETMDSSRYAYYAKVAQKEGYEQIAAIFLETAEHEKSHAKSFYRFLEGSPVRLNAEYPQAKIGNTMDNLKLSIEAENDEWKNIYSKYEQTALAEGFKEIATRFRLISKVERFHADRFARLLNNLSDAKVFKKNKKVKWMCRKCGFIHEGKTAPKNCPACEHPQSYFEVLAENY
jgi:rubrerythrin